VRIQIKPSIKPNLFARYIGVDPGTVNLGIASLDGYADISTIILYQISMERDPLQINRIINARNLMIDLFDNWNNLYRLIIEGSNFAGYRQTELAEIRTAIALWGYDVYRTKAEFVPPRSVRKLVFGTAKVRAHEYWENLKQWPDAAAALSIAYYGMIKEEK